MLVLRDLHATSHAIMAKHKELKMIITVNHVSQFRDAFAAANRKEQFSYEALGVLFEYLEEVNPEYDLDVIELCCDYTEASAAYIADQYDIDTSEGDAQEIVLAWLQDNGALVGATACDSIVYSNVF